MAGLLGLFIPKSWTAEGRSEIAQNEAITNQQIEAQKASQKRMDDLTAAEIYAQKQRADMEAKARQKEVEAMGKNNDLMQMQMDLERLSVSKKLDFEQDLGDATVQRQKILNGLEQQRFEASNQNIKFIFGGVFVLLLLALIFFKPKKD